MKHKIQIGKIQAENKLIDCQIGRKIYGEFA